MLAIWGKIGKTKSETKCGMVQNIKVSLPLPITHSPLPIPHYQLPIPHFVCQIPTLVAYLANVTKFSS